METTAILQKVTYSCENGEEIKHIEKNEVFVVSESVGSKEFFNAAQQGVKPNIKLIMCSYDYNDETNAILDNSEYDIYRTYIVGDNIELYLTQKIGSDNYVRS